MAKTIPDSHLQSPIRPHERRLLLDTVAVEIPREIRRLQTTLPVNPELIVKDSEVTYGRILGYLYTGATKISDWLSDGISTITDASSKVIAASLLELGIIWNHPPPHPRQDQMFTYVFYWDDLRTRMQLLTRGTNEWKVYPGTCEMIQKVYYSWGYALLKIQEVWYVYDYLQVLMITDTLWARVNTILFNHMLPSTVPGKLDIDCIIALYKTVDIKFEIVGNDLYSSIKYWEPIMLGQLIEQYDPLHLRDSFRQVMLDGLIEEQSTLGDEWVELLDEYQLNENQLSELFGLYRHFGHPTVDEEGGCLKIKKIVEARRPPKAQTMNNLVGVLQRSFISTFIQKEGRWPKVTNSEELQSPVLREMIKNNARHINLYTSEVTLSDWKDIEFGQELDFDYHPDYTELLDDKALAPPRSKVRAIYHSAMLGYRAPKLLSSRRLMIAILEMSQLSVKEIIDKISQRKVPKDWMIIILHAKERELKLLPRMFALMVLEIRMYFAVTEANIKNKVFRYFPQQTMTLNESDSVKRLLGFTSVKKDSDYLSLFVMIDFSAWNTHWSLWSTAAVFRFLDRVLGLTEVYTYTHEFFRESLIALSSNLNPPTSVVGKQNSTGDPKECNTLWYNHHGGFDGLRQKGWTLVTIGLLLLVESVTGIKFQKIGQADNQVCRLYILKENPTLSDSDYIRTHPVQIQAAVDRFWEALNTLSADIGLKTKPEESAVSSNVMIYGKNIYVNGARTSMASKGISRAFPDVNEVYPSTFTKIGTLQTSGLTASHSGYDIVTACHYTQILTLLHFRHAISYSYLTMTKIPTRMISWVTTLDASLLLLLSNSDAGGLPIQSLYHYLYRGHPDPLTTYTTYLYHCASHIPIAAKMYSYFQKRLYTVGRADPELLISNPCSTNIASYPLLSSRFRSVLEELIIGMNKNRQLKELFPKNTKAQDQRIFNFLMKHRPLHPRFLHEVFRLTTTSARLTFIAKFANTRTSQLLLSKAQTQDTNLPDYEDLDFSYEHEKDPAKRLVIHDIDIGLVEYLQKLYKTVVALVPLAKDELICPTQLANDMRNYSWMELTEGERIEGVTVPHPCHQFTFSSSRTGEHSECQGTDEHITYILDSTDCNTLLTTIGSTPAYIGSRTREKVVGKIYTIASNSRPYQAAERAITLTTWCVDEIGSLFKFMQDLARSRTDVPLDVLEKCSGYIAGGSMPHRLDDHVTKSHTSNNFNINITSHVFCSTDLMGRFARGQENYVMHFQGVMHLGYSLILTKAVYEQLVSCCYHLHYRGSCCEEVIPDILITGDADIPALPFCPENPLLYTKITDLHDKSLNVYQGFPQQKHYNSAWAMAYILLGRIKSKLYTIVVGTVEKVDHKSTQFGVQEVRRVGLVQVMRWLALLICLHIDASRDSVVVYLTVIPTDIWSDIASVLLFPEFLPLCASYLELDGLADMYSKLHVLCKALNAKLKSEVMTILELLRKQKYHILDHPPFHITQDIKLSHMLRMWGREVHFRFKGKYKMREVISEALKTYYEEVSPEEDIVGSTPMSAVLIKRILCKYGYEGFREIWLDNKPILTYIPPESILRVQPLTTLEDEIMRQYPREIPDMRDIPANYIMTLKMPVQSENVSTVRVTCEVTSPIVIRKYRNDQRYRIVGQVSTAYLKYYEIVLREGWNNLQHALCIADGEGSVSRMFSILTHNPVYYNSLVAKENLPQHRGYQYIPGAFLDNPTLCKGGMLAAITGGDITTPEVQEGLMELITNDNVHIDIITCDAESSSAMSPLMTINILKSFVKLAHHLQIQRGILKTFLSDPVFSAYMGGLLQLIWTEVKLVTVVMSSHENTECFWVCQDFHPKISMSLIDTLPPYHVVVPDSCKNAVTPLRHYYQQRTRSQVPYQASFPGVSNLLLRAGLSMGFRLQGAKSFNAITNHLYPYMKDKSLEHNLLYCLHDITVILGRLLKSYQYVYEGAALSMAGGALMSRSSVMHQNFELYIVAAFNIKTAFALYKCSNNPEQLKRKYEYAMNNSIRLHDDYGKVIYTYHPTNRMEWDKAYLKHIWRTVGCLEYESKDKKKPARSRK
ncbi:putative large polymerase protein [Anisopteromalus calandrae negative-strand RNA virus 1]|uniref:RNA-directed RNA polymerase L n=1 Tax=Anisopteromalus calandrae negative-strand RNA virus 1 TaxID=2848909 RepID=A0AAE7S118_9MONO|nr:putative large polymerase protein [Anisopteromalus calandrae negative-strand RNA virus 1]QWT43285.1 putative large polymerase protein [Anisopteromalus calandrae negative-strand RNA virus 1]